MIKFNKVSIKYINEFYSLYNFNCAIENHTLFIGDFFDGTTAIMRILSKIDKHYLGDVFIDNVNLKNIKDKDINLAYIPQKPVLFKKTFKNLDYVLKIRKINKNERKNKINSIICKYNLQNVNKNTKLLNLSEQKIVCLLRAVIRKPKYILLENFYEDLAETYINLVKTILKDVAKFSTIIACEIDETKLDFFKGFKIIKLITEDKEKKEV